MTIEAITVGATFRPGRKSDRASQTVMGLVRQSTGGLVKRAGFVHCKICFLTEHGIEVLGF